MTCTSLRFATRSLFVIAVLAGLSCVQADAEAQLIRQLKSEYRDGAVMQYGPNDPAERSRVFNLQTGHAGAFYNCDGEEDKRHSPYICWKSSHGSHWYRPIRDVLQWKRDRQEIAQRICDGAGACCGGGCEQKSECGCQACTGQPLVAKVKEQPTKNLIAAKATDSRAKKSKLSVREGVVGLLSSKPRSENTAIKKTPRQETKVARTEVAKKLTATQAKEAECDCLACRAKRGVKAQTSSIATLKLSQDTESKPVRSASLLERARAIRNR